MSVRRFAITHGLSPLTLYVWRRKLGRTRSRKTGADRAGLVAVDVLERDDVGVDSFGGFEVSLSSGHRVRVPTNFDAAGLAKLLTVLRAC